VSRCGLDKGEQIVFDAIQLKDSVIVGAIDGFQNSKHDSKRSLTFIGSFRLWVWEVASRFENPASCKPRYPAPSNAYLHHFVTIAFVA